MGGVVGGGDGDGGTFFKPANGAKAGNGIVGVENDGTILTWFSGCG